MDVLIVKGIKGESRSADICAESLATALRELFPHWHIELIAPPSLLSINSLPFKIARYVYRYLLYPLTLLRKDVDVYHVADHSYGHLVPFLQQSKSTLVTCHDLINARYPENLNREAQFPRFSAAMWRGSVYSMRAATHVITVSNHTKRETERLLNISQDRISVVPNGIGESFRKLPNSEAKSFRREHGADSRTLCLLHVGSVVARKNVLSILKVVKMLRDRGILVRLWKVGAKFNSEHEAFIQRHRLNKAVHFLGALPLSDLVRAYNAADVFVFPSTHEGFGMPVIEAMACGTPVVTSNVSALPETAGDAAIKVGPTDVEAMTKAILSLRNSPAYRKEMVDKGLTRAKAFTWKKAAQQVASVYESIVAERDRHV